MLKGINEFAIPQNLSREEEFALLAKYGFQGVELNITRDFTAEEVAEIKALSAKYNVQIIGPVTSNLWDAPLTSNDPEVREKGKEAVKLLIRTAKVFGCDSVLVVPGAVNKETSYEQAYANTKAALTDLIPYIEENKVNVCIENVWNKFILSPYDMKNFVESFNCEYINCYFDAGNVLLFSLPEYWPEVLGSRIKRVHIKDFKCDKFSFCNLLEGDLDFGRFMTALRATGYDGFITAEIFPDRGVEEFLKNASEAMDKILAL